MLERQSLVAGYKSDLAGHDGLSQLRYTSLFSGSLVRAHILCVRLEESRLGDVSPQISRLIEPIMGAEWVEHELGYLNAAWEG